MTAKSTNSDAASNIFVDGKPLATYLEDKEDKKKKEELLQEPEKHYFHKKPRLRQDSEKLRTMPGRTLPRPEMIKKFLPRIIKEMLMEELMTKTDYVATILMTGGTVTALSITQTLKEQGVKIERFDTTSILTRLTKSPAGRYVASDRSKKPYRYQVLETFALNFQPTDLVNLYNSRHPFSAGDVERRCPELKGIKAPGYIEEDVPPPVETQPTVDTGAEHPTGLGKVAGAIVPELNTGNDVRIHISFGPIRVLFGVDKGVPDE